MNSPTKGRVVAITGASAGVGRAAARAFAKRGASVGLLARGRDGLEATRREVEELGGRALIVPTDVADPDAVEAAAEAIEGAFGPIDVWVNNAMASVFSPVKQMKAEEYRRATEVTYLGTVYGTLAALRRMLPRDRKALGQWPRHRALCSWCLVAAGASFASVPLALPEAVEVLRGRRA